MKKLPVLICLCLASIHILAQKQPQHKKVHLAYLGESIVNPGLRLGYSCVYLEKTKTKKITDKFPEGKPKVHSLGVLYQLGFYSRRNLYTSIPLTASFFYNRTRAKGFVTQYSMGLGYDRSFLKGTTYEVDNSGSVSEKKWAGSGNFSTQFAVGFGVDLTKISNPIPIGLMYKNTLLVKHDYNNTQMPLWLTELSLTYTLNN